MEIDFYEQILTQISLSTPASLAIGVPSSNALKSGARRLAAGPEPPKAVPVGPTVFLMGNSIAREVCKPLRELGKDKFNVEYLKRQQSPWDGPQLIVPKARGEGDVLVLMFLGNEMFIKSEHYFSKGRYHLTEPRYHSDATAAKLVDNICLTLGKVHEVFKGRVKVVGPLPRHLKRCCKSPAHTLEKSPIFKSTLHYAEIWNKFLMVHPKLRVFPNTEFVDFESIFGDVFQNKWLRDGVHLTSDSNQMLADFVSTLPGGRVLGMPDPLPVDTISFTTWAAMQPGTRSVSGGGGGNNTSPASQSSGNVSAAAQNGGSNNNSSAGQSGGANVTGAAAAGATSAPDGMEVESGAGASVVPQGEELPDYESGEEEEDDRMDTSNKHADGGKAANDKGDEEFEKNMRAFDESQN